MHLISAGDRGRFSGRSVAVEDRRETNCFLEARARVELAWTDLQSAA
jgi:hypothetical protein